MYVNIPPIFYTQKTQSSYKLVPLNADFQKDLSNIFTWTQQNQIAFNASKCTHLPAKRATSSDFYFDSILIKKVSEEKDLGVPFCQMAQRNLPVTREKNE